VQTSCSPIFFIDPSDAVEKGKEKSWSFTTAYKHVPFKQ